MDPFERKFSLTPGEVDGTTDPQKLAEQMGKIADANENLKKTENKIERNIIDEVDEEISDFQLALAALESMEKNYINANDSHIKQLAGKELLDTKKAVYEKIDAYIVKLRNENYINMDQQKQLVEIRNQVFKIRNEDSRFSIAA